MSMMILLGALAASVALAAPEPGSTAAGLPVLDSPKAFRVERQRVDDRSVLLIDGDPLFCVLDATPDPAFLAAARQSGVNTLALDYYWRELEPRPGGTDWARLEQAIQDYGRCGFALIFLVNIHQPAWVAAECADEPRTRGSDGVYPNAPAVRRHFAEFLGRFLQHTAGYSNVLAYGLSAGGEADGDFHEVAGDISVWRQSPACLQDFRAFLKTRYATPADLQAAWGVEGDGVTFDNAVPPPPLGPPDAFWRDTRAGAHDWRAFIDRFWITSIEWQARLVRQAAPQKLTLVRLSWPVFQTFNPFLARGTADWLDLLQVKDAVPTWERATPAYLRSRAAMFHAATRGTPIVNFPEVDVGHNHGEATPDEIATFLPAVSEFAGGVWYYRGVRPAQWAGIAAAAPRVKEIMLRSRGNPADRVAVFYAERYANWIQNHTAYDNEDSLAGVVRALDAAGARFDIVSEDCLADLARYRTLIITAAPYLPREASDAIATFIARGGRVLAESDVASFDLAGRDLEASWKGQATLLAPGSMASIRPKEGSIVLDDQGRALLARIGEFPGP
ncbi:MAG: beta-galactosidase [Lentisphaerae bacterium]|nr:beta-galactosidase [Lentisphaerota bacterium]